MTHVPTKLLYHNYDGETSNNLPSGQGQCTFLNGVHYEGSFLHGLPHGSGTLTFSSGLTIISTFFNGRCNGFTTIKRGDSTLFSGEAVGMLPHGQGSSMGYEGTFYQGRRQGKGTYNANINGKELTFDGQWFNDLKYGKGKLSSNSESFEGIFEEDTKHGFGVSTGPGGVVYVGNWYRGNRHGNGQVSINDSQGLASLFKGYFTSGSRDGIGVLTNLLNGTKLLGNWTSDSCEILQEYCSFGTLPLVERFFAEELPLIQDLINQNKLLLTKTFLFLSDTTAISRSSVEIWKILHTLKLNNVFFFKAKDFQPVFEFLNLCQSVLDRDSTNKVLEQSILLESVSFREFVDLIQYMCFSFAVHCEPQTSFGEVFNSLVESFDLMLTTNQSINQIDLVSQLFRYNKKEVGNLLNFFDDYCSCKGLYQKLSTITSTTAEFNGIPINLTHIIDLSFPSFCELLNIDEAFYFTPYECICCLLDLLSIVTGNEFFISTSDLIHFSNLVATNNFTLTLLIEEEVLSELAHSSAILIQKRIRSKLEAIREANLAAELASKKSTKKKK
ncbi:hypothetical protein P9112_001035 [Eukaryota sp. TZLM1-RC]